MGAKPAEGVLGILLEPAPGIAETKAVPPGVHVSHESVATDISQLIRQQNLQVAHRGFLDFAAASVAIQHTPTGFVHADDVAGFMEHRMDRRVRSHEYPAADQSGLRLPPKAAANGLSRLDPLDGQTKARQQAVYGSGIEIADTHDVIIVRLGSQIPES